MSAGRSFLRRMCPGAILCFHGITTPELPGSGLANVSRESFLALIEILRELVEIVPLRVLAERVARGQSTVGLVAITFDDAYVGLLDLFADGSEWDPVPVTVFVANDASEAGDRFWWDRIEDLAPRVSAARWREFENEIGLPQEYIRGQPAEYGPLRPLRQWLLARHKGRWAPELEPHLVRLEEETGYRTVQRAMTYDEIARILRVPDVEIGPHTRSHPVLPLLSDVEMSEEIAGSLERLRDRFGSVVPILAVPFGLYDRRTLEAAREAGVTVSLSVSGATLTGTRSGDAILPRIALVSADRVWPTVLRLTGWKERIRGAPRATDYPSLPSPTT